MVELRARVHVLVARGRCLHCFCICPCYRRPSDVLELFVCRVGTVASRSCLRRNRLSISDCGRSLSVGPAVGGKTLGMDGGMGLSVGPVYHHCRSSRGRSSL